MSHFDKLMRFHDHRHDHLLFLERLRREGLFEWHRRAYGRYATLYVGRTRRKSRECLSLNVTGSLASADRRDLRALEAERRHLRVPINPLFVTD